MKTISFFLISFFIISFTFAQHDETDTLKIENTTEIAVDEIILDQKDVLQFFIDFQSFFKHNDKAAVIHCIHFPIQGECIYPIVYGDEGTVEETEMNFDKEAFIAHFDTLFNENARFLIKKVDFKKLMKKEGYECVRKIDAETFYSLQYAEYDQTYGLTVSFVNIEDSLLDNGITYYFKPIQGKLMLFDIQCQW